MERFDAIVIGAGMAGSAAAWRLSRTRRVLVLEQFGFLHAAGSSHGASRIFRYAYDDLRYVELAMDAHDGWRELARDCGEELLRETGGIDVAHENTHENHAGLDRLAHALDAAGAGFTWLDAKDVARRFAPYRIARGGRAVYQADAGIVPATRAVAAMLRVAVANGAELRSEEPVTDLRPAEHGVEVRTPSGSYGADTAIVCAGPWLGTLAADLALPLTVVQQQVLYLAVGSATGLAGVGMPVFVDHDTEVYGFPLFERPDAIKVARHAGGNRLAGPGGKTDDLDRELAAEAVRTTQRLIDGIGDRIVRHVTCLYTRTPDDHFVIDRHPMHPSILLAGGFSGHGFKFAPAVGRILADLATEGVTHHDIRRFRVDRFG